MHHTREHHGDLESWPTSFISIVRLLRSRSADPLALTLSLAPALLVFPVLHPVHCAHLSNPRSQAFVQFADVPSAQRAKDAISGRMFAGNIVQAYHVAMTVYQSLPDAAH